MESSFDAKAKEWDSDPQKVELARKFTDCLLKTIDWRSSFKVLEFGCGTALVSMNLVDRTDRIYLSDTSNGMLEVARAKIDRCGIKNVILCPGELNENANTLPPLDVVYSLMAFHHIRDIDRLVAVIARLLKPGGMLCIGDLEAEDGSFHQGDFDGHHGFDLIALEQTLEQAGLNVCQVTRFHQISKPDKEGEFKDYPLFFMGVRKMLA